MAIIKCKMCGGDLELKPDATVAECEYCGSVQTIPNQDNEKKLTLFARANRLRMACEFDKAAGVYEALVGEFPEEAEAYWGLVLCKFGIEYVDDPKTGKKIPTCHRSSFESVMDDPNLEQAMENTDAVARKVMREEAKQIETIRQRIIEVSSKEEPYDVFICYKETDEHGDRTVDSEMAQNIYEALTERDYRVFFARISLMEDALGKEYEPFIFAALHSAPIMLAIGTDYEHYNAIWVKNEWSRFLMMKEAGMNKTLIPCFKDIDAYDLPKEFRSLQAVNLGKVGAMQDLLSGIEKILPKKKAPAVVEVQRGVSPNVESLLKRGNMFLEDKDWQSADKYFDDVLDIDPECAEAYLGKTLTQHRCMKPDGLVLARLAATAEAKYQKRTARERDREREYEIIQRHSLYKYVRMEDIRKHFELNAEYTSAAASRKAQYEAEQDWFRQDKYMSRAMRYATGACKQKLLDIQKKIYEGMEQRIAEAEKSDDGAVKRICDQYEENLKRGDAEGKKLREAAEQKREADYQSYGVQAEKAIEANERKALAEAQGLFKDLKDYKNSEMMVKILQEKIDAIDAAEEAERQRIAAAKEAERQRIAAEQRYAAEVKAAYEKEQPLLKERPQTEARLKEIYERVKELSGKLERHGGLVFCIIFFALGVVEFIAGMDGVEGLAFIGGFCAVGFGIAVVAILKHRAKMRKERKALLNERAVLEKKLDAMNRCMSLQEFTRVYALRQTEEGRAQLAEEERQRRLQEQREAEAARIAKRKRTTKKIIRTTVTLLIIAAIIFAFWYLTAHVIPSDRIKKAEAAIDAGDYQLAYDELHENGDYKNTLALREDIAAHGEYRLSVIYANDADYDDYYYFYEYNEAGLPSRMSSYNAKEVTLEDGEYSCSDARYDWQLTYTFYESGNLKTCSIYDALDNGELDRELEFYDDPTASVKVLPVYHEEPDRFDNFTSNHMCFYGVKINRRYDHEGNVDGAGYYTLQGVYLDSPNTVVDEEGRVTYYQVKASYSDPTGRTLTYNEDGSVATLFIDDDLTDNGARDYSDENWKYEYKSNIKGQLISQSAFRGVSKTANWELSYGYNADNGMLTRITVGERDDDTVRTEMTYTLTWEWCDYAEAAAKIAEEKATLAQYVSDAEAYRMQGEYDKAVALYETAQMGFATLGDHEEAERCAQEIVRTRDEQIQSEKDALYEILQNVNPGDVVNFASFEWIALEKKNDEVLLLSKDLVGNLEFDEDYDSYSSNPAAWKTSDMYPYLNVEFFETYLKDYGNIYGTVNEDTVSLLTAEQYFKYEPHIILLEDDWWLRDVVEYQPTGGITNKNLLGKVCCAYYVEDPDNSFFEGVGTDMLCVWNSSGVRPVISINLTAFS